MPSRSSRSRSSPARAASLALAVLVGLGASGTGCGAPAHDDAPTGAPTGAPAGAPAVAARPVVTAQHEGTTMEGRFAYRWRSEPDPIPFNEPFSLHVTVTAPGQPDRPLPGATLESNAHMPAHGHGMNTRPRVTRVADGSFRVDGMLFHMPGLWSLVFIVKDGGLYDTASVPVTIE